MEWKRIDKEQPPKDNSLQEKLKKAGGCSTCVLWNDLNNKCDFPKYGKKIVLESLMRQYNYKLTPSEHVVLRNCTRQLYDDGCKFHSGIDFIEI